MNLDSKNIQALIHLLDDTDEEVYTHVYTQLKQLGTAAIPSLEDAYADAEDIAFAQRLETLIQEIQQTALEEDFSIWLHTTDHDILQGAFLVTKIQHPEYSFEVLADKIKKIKQKVWLEMHPYLTPFEHVSIINQILYQIYGLQSASISEHKLDHLFPSTVLQEKKGNALSIGIIYQYVAQLLHIPIYGVSLPRHFILAYCKEYANQKTILEDDVLFYINPISKGAIFSRNEVKDYIHQLNIEDDIKYYLPTSNKLVVKEQLQYLRNLYELRNQVEKVTQIERILELF